MASPDKRVRCLVSPICITFELICRCTHKVAFTLNLKFNVIYVPLDGKQTTLIIRANSINHPIISKNCVLCLPKHPFPIYLRGDKR